MNTVVMAECPLESWHLVVQVKVDAVKHPDKECWPKGKIKVSVAEREDFGGKVDSGLAQLADDGKAPAITPVEGTAAQKDLWIKAEPDDGAPWGTPAPQKVTVKPHQSTSVVLELEPTGGALEVALTRSDGKPLQKQLAFKIAGPENKDGLATAGGKRLLSPLKPGDYTVQVSDLNALLVQEGNLGWKLGPDANGKLKAKVEKGKVAKVELHLTRYSKAQFVAFDVMPGLARDAKKNATGYLGASTNFEDLGRRYLLMKKAMQTALGAPGVKKDDEDTLKIFMAPEFYWRGRDGAYPIEQVSDIMELLRPEAQKADYKDWLFVFGTAIGYYQHGDHKKAEPFKLLVKSVGTWDDGGNQLPTVNLVADPSLKRSKSSPVGVCARIQQQAAKPIRWQVSQGRGSWWPWGPMEAGVFKSEKVSDDEYKLYLDSAEAFATGTIALKPVVATEVFNLALIQRGGPAAQGGGLSEAIVYKEFISHIDFLGGPAGQKFHAPDGSGRTITIHGVKGRIVLPTQGSSDKLGASANKIGDPGVSEVNKSGLGGGSLFTMSGISFGMEVCRDHCVNRLRDYLDKHAKPGEPMPQIHLIPCWGMSIAEGPVCTVKDGLVFLVDGPKGPDAGILGGPEFRCPKHSGDLKNKAGDCAQVDFYECKDHGHYNAAGGNCSACGRPVQTDPAFVCTGPHERIVGVVGAELTGPEDDCSICGTKLKRYRFCTACGKQSAQLNACTSCSTPVQTVDVETCHAVHVFAAAASCCGKPADDKSTHFCGNHYQRADSNGPCPNCTKAMTPGHHKLHQVWTGFAKSGETPVADLSEKVTINKVSKTLASDHDKLFERKGKIVVYPVKPIPPGATF